MDEAFQRDLEGRIRTTWIPLDENVSVRIEHREDGKLALTIVSNAFLGMDSFEREALLWPVMQKLPNDILVRMTYSLLLTHEEADRYFAEEAPEERTPI